MCYVLVMDVYNDKVVGNSEDTTADTVTYTDSEAISIPAIEDITKDDNFVDVSNIVSACMHVCVWGGGGRAKLNVFLIQCVHHCVVFYNNRDHLNNIFRRGRRHGQLITG